LDILYIIESFLDINSDINFPIDELQRKEVDFIESEEYNESFELLKRKLVEASILRFFNWSKQFHVHVDALKVEVNIVLSQLDDEIVDHPNMYSRRKLNNNEYKYSTTEREGLAMIFSLQKFHRYSLENPFTFFTDHQDLKYLVNKIVHQGIIC